MKKCIGLTAAVLSLLSSSLTADEAPVAATEQEPKQVGKASADAANTAKSSHVAKYVLAGGAVAIGITALILVSRHDGHHHHSSHNK